MSIVDSQLARKMKKFLKLIDEHVEVYETKLETLILLCDNFFERSKVLKIKENMPCKYSYQFSKLFNKFLVIHEEITKILNTDSEN